MQRFNPPLFLRNQHIQSIIGSLPIRRAKLEKKAANLLRASRPHIIDCGNNIRLQAYHSQQINNQNSPLVIMLHGWHGSHESLYLLSTAAQLYQEGYQILRLNLRDHGNTHHLNKEFFHSCRLDEVISAIEKIGNDFTNNAMALVGFSLGGNFSLRVALYAKKRNINLAKVIAICPVLDPMESLIALDSGFSGYRKYFLKGWWQTLRDKDAAFPNCYDINDAFKCTDLTQMTDFFVRNFTNYETMESYLKDYSIINNKLENLSIPSTIIAATDDPVIPSHDLKKLAQSNFLSIEENERGGHCGFINNLRLDSWLDQRIATILRSYLSIK